MGKVRAGRSSHGDVCSAGGRRGVWLSPGDKVANRYFDISVRKLIVVLAMNEEIGNRNA
jgi:hypothetical protein